MKRVPILYIVILTITSQVFVSCSSISSSRGTAGNDAVLRNMTIGVNELYKGHYNEAKKVFTKVAIDVGAVWGDSAEAKKARSLWYEESSKPFKGEPYERMMAFYYTGLLYLMSHDYGNAQAAFRNSVMQDAFAEEDQNRADVMLPVFLQGWALQRQGSLNAAQNAYDLVKKIRPDIQLPSMKDPPNVLIIAETGNSPRKVSDGVGSFQLRFFRGKKFKEKRVSYSLNGRKSIELYPIEDIFWQAASRGGRAVDKIIDGKVAFKSSVEGLGLALSEASRSLLYTGGHGGSGSQEGFGRALGVIGVGALVLSAYAKPAVDDRYWDNLPDIVHIAAIDLPPGKHSLDFTFQDMEGHSVLKEKTVNLEIPEDRNHSKVVWISSRNRISKKYH